MKTASILLAVLGLVLLTGFTGWLGAGAVVRATLSVGVGGFAALVLWQALTDGVLALAWSLACPGIGLPRLLGARIVREAATTCLPFSQVGGILIAVRATCFPATARRRAVLWPEAAAANVLDITAEVIGQIGFVLLGLLLLVDRRPDSSFAGPVAIGMVLMALAMAAFVWMQRSGSGLVRRLLRGLGGHVAGQWQDALRGGMHSVQDKLDHYYARPGRVAAAALVHGIAWIAGAGWVWLAYRLLGAPIGFGEALAIEGVASGVLSVSFLVPAALGVQEAAYVALGSLFGLDPHLSFGLSLLRRGRDLCLGVPALLAWQGVEIRRLRRSAPAETADAAERKAA
ncbi:lysylphosphatidylglycerol synthase domain-containing protein [Rhizosaccharibacter radicis]|uniref:Lysylphosphatidylglycerol synthase domain-containing protein n=1 Tax=Rhizosaccharibacter radicis TaxID=2782605 RepID=A0ABT1W0E6_9PROT|nr:lysylphosphatidylglycerol synthase domain-containing protein [Acetobacteraceae bacterium KSS12]